MTFPNTTRLAPFAALFILVLLTAMSGAQADAPAIRERPAEWGAAMLSDKVDNFYRVDDGVYRSAQPDKHAMRALSEFGIVEVLNLRDFHDDNDEAKALPMSLHRVEMDTDDVSDEQLIQALQLIQQRKGPIVIHCWHGSDRTGTTIAAYRIVFNDWSKARAIDEMVNGGYGYHHRMFPHLVTLVENLDVARIKQALGMP